MHSFFIKPLQRKPLYWLIPITALLLMAIAGGKVALAADPVPIANPDNPPDTNILEDAVGPTIDVLANDTLGDAPTEIVSVSPVIPSGSGSVAIGGGGTIIEYTAPSPDFNRSGLGFTYTITDAEDELSVTSVIFNVLPVNDAPSFTPGGNVTVLEDSSAYSEPNWATAISSGPSNESTQTLNFIVTATDTALFSVQPAVSPAGELTFTPAANAFGSTNVSVQLMDNGGTGNGGVNKSAVANLTITITGVNDQPSFTKGVNRTVTEDAAAYSEPNWATAISAGPANESAQTLNFIVTAVDTALFSTQPAISPAGTLSFTPAANAFGSTSVSVQLMDSGGTGNGGVDKSAIETFNINITPINDQPSFTKGANQNVAENSGPISVPTWATNISPGPTNELAQSVAFNVTNNTNPTLFSAGPSISPAGTLTFTPAASQSGSATISINLMDNGGTANGGVDTSAVQTFVINVGSVNDAPSFVKGANVTVLEDAAAFSQPNWATSISPGPPDESGQTVTFMVTNNSNPALFAAGPAVSPVGTLTFTPAPNAFGSATITIVLKDDGGVDNGGVDTSAPQSFSITVTPVNDKPSFIKGSDITVWESSGVYVEAAWATAISRGPANESAQTLTFIITDNSNPTLFAAGPTIDPSGQLEFTPSAGVFGSATITVNLKDSGGTGNGGDDTSVPRIFTITVDPINDAPAFVKGPDIQVNEDFGPFSQPGWATSISAGPPNESGQSLTFIVTNNTNPSLFETGPTVSPTGELTFTPMDDLFGIATISIILMDDGGTESGGKDTSTVQSFTIEILAVNDPPRARRDAAQTFLNTPVTFVVIDNDTDVDDPIDPSTLTITQQPANGSASENTTTGEITYTPDPGFIGADELRYRICDPQNSCDTARVDLNVGAIDLQLSKFLTPPLSQVAPGDLIVYSLDVTNNGSTQSNGVVISDTVPLNTTFNASESSGVWSCADGSPAGTVCEQSIGSLAGPGGMASVQFAVDVLDPITQESAQITNVAEVSDDGGNGPDFDRSNNRSVAAVPLTTAVIMLTTKRDSLAADVNSDSLVGPGDTVRYEVIIENNGNIAAQNTQFVDQIDANAALVVGSVTTTQGSVTTGNNTGDSDVEVLIGAIAPNTPVTIFFDVTIDNPAPANVSQIANQGLVTGSNFPTAPTDDPDTLALNDATITLLDTQISIAATKIDGLAIDADGDELPSPGDTLLYTVTIVNNGNQAASAVIFTDTVGANVTLVPGTVTTSRGTTISGDNAGDSIVEIDVGLLPGSGASAVITFQVRIDNPLPGNVFELVNQGRVSGPDFDPVLTDDPALPNSDDPTRTAVNADVAVYASLIDYLFVDNDENDAVSSGDILLYRITVVNEGNKTALGVRVNNVLDPLLTLLSGTVQTNLGTVVSGNNPSDTAVAVDIGSLDADTTAVISFQVRLQDVSELLSFSNQLTVILNDPSGGSTPLEVPSDDPDTSMINDPTITPVMGAVTNVSAATIFVPFIALAN